jgi:hypothetical protein
MNWKNIIVGPNPADTWLRYIVSKKIQILTMRSGTEIFLNSCPRKDD